MSRGFCAPVILFRHRAFLARALTGLALLATVAAVPPSTSAAPEPARQKVVFVGGLGSTSTTTTRAFAPLAAALAGQGFTSTDVSIFGYEDADTCRPLASSAAHLAAYLRQLRDSGQASSVVLVGHSMGGVVALDAASQFDDLTSPGRPFVQRVITVDSPLGGITRLQRSLLVGLWMGACPAANDAAQRFGDAAWPSTLSGRVGALLERGVKVFAVANPEDLLLGTWTQQVPSSPDSAVNVILSAQDESVNHLAVLTAPTTIAEIAQMVGARGAA
jgi:pimeloyl-ACP methyl ester carboxylesterase